MCGKQITKIGEIGREVLRCDSRILPTGPRFGEGGGSAAQPCRQTRPVFAHAPQRFALCRIGYNPAVLQPAALDQPCEEILRLSLDLGHVLAVEVDVQPGVAGRQSANRIRPTAKLHRLDDLLVDTFHRGGRELQNGHHVLGGLDDVLVTEAEQQCRRRYRNQGDGNRHHDGTRAFTPDECARDVEPVLRQ